jgi:GTPase
MENNVDEPTLQLFLAGKANAGKSSLVNALLRRPLAEMSPTPGETSEVRRYRYNESLVVVDTPGLGVGETEADELTWNALEDADVLLYLINSLEGPTKAAVADITRLQDRAVPVRVLLSRSDKLTDPVQKAEFKNDALLKLGLSEKNLQFVSDEGEGLNELSEWIQSLDTKGLEWARVMRTVLPALQRQLDTEASDIIHLRAIAAGVVAAVPIPLADIVPLSAIHLEMAYQLGEVYREELEKERLLEVLGVVGVGIAWQTAARQLLKFIPFAGWAISAGMAFAGTEGIGHALKAYFAAGMRWDEEAQEELKEMAAREAKESKRRFDSDPALRSAIKLKRDRDEDPEEG